MMAGAKIKGSVMGLVLAITMLVMLLCAFMTLRSGLDARIHLALEQQDRLLNNAESGFQWLLSPHNPVPLNGHLTTDLFETGQDSVYLERKTWGVFEIVISRSFCGPHSRTKTALLGARPPKGMDATSLYVADLQKPISVCGKTKLSGKCHVPAAGFKRAYIEGQNYQGDRYVYGQQFVSKDEIPGLHQALVASVKAQLEGKTMPGDSLVHYTGIDSLVRGFDRPGIVIRSAVPLRLSGHFIKGNIRILAPVVIVESSCTIEDILIIADEIRVEDHCVIRAQLFARKKITTGEETRFLYPSALVVYDQNKAPKDSTEDGPQLFIGKGSTVTGDLVAWKEKKYLERDAWLSIDPGTTISGQVYVNGRLDNKGAIYGSAYCTKVFLKTTSGIYENHLLNAVFDASQLPDFYTGACLLQEGMEREVLQWL